MLVESPYAGATPEETAANVAYLDRCLLDSMARGEAPFASHRFYTQFLDDTIPEERAMGIECGLVWGAAAELTAVYVDRGISKGMRLGMERAEAEGRPTEKREIGDG